MLDWYAKPRYQPFSLIHDDSPVDRPGVLMIHGFSGSPDELRAVARIAFEAGCDVEVMCLPGMGADVARLRDITGRDWLDAAKEAWSSVRSRYRYAVLLGYSLGGALAMHAAAADPPAEMVLLSPLVRLADRKAIVLPLAKHVIRELMPFRGMDFERSSSRRFFEQVMPGLDINDPTVQESIRREYVLPTNLIDDCRRIGREAGRKASGITIPTTIIQGRPDHVVGHRNARWLVDRLGGRVDYHEVPGNHLIPLDTVRSWSEVRPILERVFARFTGNLDAAGGNGLQA